MTVSEGSVYLDPFIYSKFETVVQSGANTYFDLAKDSASISGSTFSGSGNITQIGGYTFNVTESMGSFNGTYRVKDGTLMFAGKESSSNSVVQYGDIIADSGSLVGGWVNLKGDLTLKSGSTLLVGDN